MTFQSGGHRRPPHLLRICPASPLGGLYLLCISSRDVAEIRTRCEGTCSDFEVSGVVGRWGGGLGEVGLARVWLACGCGRSGGMGWAVVCQVRRWQRMGRELSEERS